MDEFVDFINDSFHSAEQNHSVLRIIGIVESYSQQLEFLPEAVECFWMQHRKGRSIANRKPCPYILPCKFPNATQ
jgi:hypothetical protein